MDTFFLNFNIVPYRIRARREQGADPLCIFFTFSSERDNFIIGVFSRRPVFFSFPHSFALASATLSFSFSEFLYVSNSK